MWSIVYLVIGVVVFVSFLSYFLSEWNWVQPMIIGVYSSVMILILFLSLNTQYYEINKKDLTECKFGKKYVYFYSDVLYIDEEQAKRGTLAFVTKFGHVKYLNLDKEGLIYQAMINKCKNLITLDEVRMRFPGIKI